MNVWKSRPHFNFWPVLSLDVALAKADLPSRRSHPTGSVANTLAMSLLRMLSWQQMAVPFQSLYTNMVDINEQSHADDRDQTVKFGSDITITVKLLLI